MTIAIATLAHMFTFLPLSLNPSCLLHVFVSTTQTTPLLKAGVECTQEYLEGSEGKAEVIGEYEKGVGAHGITGVPYFIISREGSTATVPLSGGQPPEVFVEAFEALSS